MLTKFETRSNRVKSVSFHSKRPWVLCGLHSGAVQIWDYRLGTSIDRYEEHDGPVRGVDFHVAQPLFATGSDDYKIKLWNFKYRRCVATFTGHLDYIRQVQFHKEQPWLVSSSDDQTLRIWNWQSRMAISVLTGHNHYVMSAHFHPREDLIVSASMDLTIRVWDISGLRAKKNTDTSMALPQDLFGSTDVVVKWVLEGHEKGVNWAAFHPTKPLIVSAADDRSVRVWRMDDTRAYEVDQLRGHTNNVTCVCYFKDFPVSVSEDHTVRVWDPHHRTAIQTFRRDGRFWVIAAHPESNLLVVGHDSGLVVFKLERERPALTINNNVLYWVKERTIRTYDFATKQETSPMTLRRHTFPPVTLSCNPADSSAALWYEYDGGVFELFTIPRPGALVDADVKKGFYTSAVFFSANKFALLDKQRQLVLRTTGADGTKTLPPVGESDRLFPGPQGMLVCRSDEKVYLFHVAQRSIVAECSAPKVKYVVWSADFNKVAFLSKHGIIVANRKFKVHHTLHEQTRVKSAAFDEDADVLIYATGNHLKFCSLRTGECGTLKTIDTPIYLVRAKGETIWFITRDGKVVEQRIDNTELNFKMALQQEKFKDVLKLIQARKIHGQALVAYLHKQGFPEVAMHFVQDPVLRFNLAVECGTLDVAKQCATEINDAESWRRLAEAATKFGDIQLSQFANAKTQNFHALGLQCLLTGNHAALAQVVAKSKDEGFQFLYSTVIGDAARRIKLLESGGQLPLAYTLAKSHGFEEDAERLLAAMPPDVAARCVQVPVREPISGPDVEAVPDNWALLPVAESYFTRMLKDPSAFDYRAADSDAAAPAANGKGAAKGAGGGGGWGDDDDLDLDEDKAANGAGNGDGDAAAGATGGAGGGEWDDSDLDIDVGALPSTATGTSSGAGAGSSTLTGPGGFVAPREGESAARHWVDTSNVPAFHVAAGSFASTLQLLQRQIGLVNAEPLLPVAMQIWATCNGAMPSVSLLPAHLHAVTAPPGAQEMSAKHSPLLPNSLPALTERLKIGYETVTGGKFGDAQRIFQSILTTAVFAVVETQQQTNDVRDVISIAREYTAALNVELARKEATNPVTALELACYFTHFKLQPLHLTLCLGQAMNVAYKAGNLKSAANLARRMLEQDPSQERAEKARKVILAVEAKGATEALKMDYDDRNPFTLCSVSKRPMYRGTVEPVRCSYCFAQAHPQFKGQQCPVCMVARIGGEASGMIIARRKS